MLYPIERYKADILGCLHVIDPAGLEIEIWSLRQTINGVPDGRSGIGALLQEILHHRNHRISRCIQIRFVMTLLLGYIHITHKCIWHHGRSFDLEDPQGLVLSYSTFASLSVALRGIRILTWLTG